MDWCEVLVRTTTSGGEIVGEIFQEAGARGVSVEDRADLEQYIQRKDDWEMLDEDLVESFGADVLVRAWFARDERLGDTLRDIRERLHSLLEMSLGLDLGKLTLETCDVQDEDWENNWKEYYKPFMVGERLWIRPAWEDQHCQGRVELVMEPGMAFGTGTHETTFLCLELAQDYIHGGETVLDVGCGTGILGIAALLLGAQSVLALDRDPIAVSAAGQNAQLNDIYTNFQAKTGDLLHGVEQQGDLIFANIIAEAVIALAPQAYEHLNAGGVLIASGIILAMQQAVTDALLAVGFEIEKVLDKGQWVAIAARKR